MTTGECIDTTTVDAVAVVTIVDSFCCFCIGFTLGITLLGREPATEVMSMDAVDVTTTVLLLVTDCWLSVGTRSCGSLTAFAA